MKLAEPSSTTHQPSAGSTAADEQTITVSVVIPCLNEAENIARCVSRAREVLHENDLPGEVIVADNDSEDGSALLAAEAGALVVHEPRARLWQRVHGRLRGRPRPVHRDGRCRPHVRLRGDPPVHRGTRRGCGHGDRQPDEEHPSGRHAVAPPLHRKPFALGFPERPVQDRHRRCPLWDASRPT